jgi:ribosomal protein S18 acetylase RimI-like enzyme
MTSDMVFRWANEEDIPTLAALWKQVFGDSDEFIFSFYKTFFKEMRIPAVFEQGKAVCACALIDCKIYAPDGSHPVVYLYALGTSPDYRSRGYGTALMDYIAEQGEAGGYEGVMLHPATESLWDYYRERGFSLAADRTVFSKSLLLEQGYTLSSEKISGDMLRRLLKTQRHKSDWAFVEGKEMQELGIRMMEYDGFKVTALRKNGDFAGCCLIKGDEGRALWLLEGHERPQEKNDDSMRRLPCGMFLSCGRNLALPEGLRMEMDFTME